MLITLKRGFMGLWNIFRKTDIGGDPTAVAYLGELRDGE